MAFKKFAGDKGIKVETEETFPEPRLYLVVHSTVYVRSAPNTGASTIGVRKQGDCLAVSGSKGSWLRITSFWMPRNYAVKLRQTLTGATDLWVPAELDGSAMLEPAPTDKLRELELTFRLSETQELASNLLSPSLKEVESYFKGAPVSLFSPFSGLEARCQMPKLEGEDERFVQPEWRVFAARAFEKGEVVERCELLHLKPTLGIDAPECIIKPHIVTRWNSQKHVELMLPLGYATLYRRVPRHFKDVLEARWSDDGAAISLIATRRIQVGDELVLSRSLAEDIQRTSKASFEPAARGPPRAERGNEQEAQSEDFSKAMEDAKTEAAAREIVKVKHIPGKMAGAVRGGWSEVHGRGVFALEEYRRHQLVELCPALKLDPISANALDAYVMHFEVGPRKTDENGNLANTVTCLSVGVGSLFNHSDNANLKWNYIPYLGGGLVAMVATQKIKAEEEIFINYGEAYWAGGKYVERDGSVRQGADAVVPGTPTQKS